jgi:carboxymethylenebutenolidase
MNRVRVMQLVRAFQVGELPIGDFLMRVRRLLDDPAQAEHLAEEARLSPVKRPRPVVARVSRDDSQLVAVGNNAEGTPIRAYVAGAPAAKLAVVVIQEWWGLNDNIKRIADRFATEGFIAAAPDLYHGVVTTEPDEARKAVMELDMQKAAQEIQAAVDYLMEQAEVEGVGVVGFCMGGRLALLMSMQAERLGAAIAFYGRALEPEQADQVRVPILGLYGSEDHGIPVESVRAMEAALKAAEVPCEFQIYQGAQHAFFNDTRASYHPEASADAWQRTLDWLREHLPA